MASRTEMDGQQWLALKDRALAVAAEGIAIADARRPGRPLMYVNDGFERLTGYSADEAIGRNCRFLQGRDTDPDAVEQIRAALAAERDCTVEILNYRKDGTAFWNRLSITPVRTDDGAVTHFIGVQSDVTQRRLAEESLRRTKEALERANAAMQRDLDEAAEIQREWLPDELPDVPGYRFAWSFTPCREVGGDSVNILKLDDDHVAVYVLDVCGHGVGAALLSASIQRWLSPVPEHSCLFVRADTPEAGFAIASPAVVAAELNRRFRAEPESGKFFTLVYGVLDVRTGDFRYATAGHPSPLSAGPDGTVVLERAAGVPIGVLEEFPYAEARHRLRGGERLLLYTDGAVEVSDADERLYGADRLLREMEKLRTRPAADALSALVDDVRRWGGADGVEDDVTMLMIEATGPAA